MPNPTTRTYLAAAPRALITGGAGFIGSHLADALMERGWTVTILDDLSTGRLANVGHLIGHPRFRFVNGSITDSTCLEPLVAQCDILFHLAAAVGVARIVDDPLGGIETNVLGTHCVLRQASRYGCTVLIASTSEIYGKSARPYFHEDDDRVVGPTSKPRWSYATSKALDEFLALAYHRQLGLPVVIFRLFNTVGPRQSGRYGMVVPRFVGQAIRGEYLTIHGDGGQSRCFCDVEDVVRAIVGLAVTPAAAGGTFNIGSTREISILDLARLVLRVVAEQRGEHASPVGWDDARIRFVSYEQAYGPDFEDMRRRAPDTSRIRDTIGWHPTVPLEETLRRVYASLTSLSSAGPSVLEPAVPKPRLNGERVALLERRTSSGGVR
jgi:UDP-glucose 4-epimerase